MSQSKIPRFKNIWHCMGTRCNKKTYRLYKDYGGRGIRIEWQSFEDFKIDMFDSYVRHCKKYGEKNTSIDRKDTSKNYCKENCKWSTRIEQNLNKRNNRRFKFNGKTQTMSQWAIELSIPKQTIYNRVLRNLPVEKILNTKRYEDYNKKEKIS